MTLKYLVALLTLSGVHSKSTYKICVPEQHLKACQDMLDVPTKSKADLACVAARVRVECLDEVQQRQADFVYVDPEDVYVAASVQQQDFVLFQEYRNKKEPDVEFRYQAVAVVHKDLPINNLDQLKGLKSCHTRIYKSVGYEIPLTMLMKQSSFPKMNNTRFSPRENELRALSSFFQKSCIVGNWSPDQKTSSVWKIKYSRLCALCEDPETCDYSDDFEGYEGALRCLIHHNGGQVAFTKLLHVRKFFGLPVETIPAKESSENPDEFAYLCADGSKVPIREEACSWAARPWPGLLGHNDITTQLKPLREKIKQLAIAGAAIKPLPDWFTKVLGLSKKVHHVTDIIPIAPAAYLQKANYTEVIEREHGITEPKIRLCVTSNVKLGKCRTMASLAISRSIRPRLDCNIEAACLKNVQEYNARLNLHPLFTGYYKNETDEKPRYAVAVVKRNSSIQKMEHLRGKRSCHNPYWTFSGLDAPLYYLVAKGLVTSDDCMKRIGAFFSGGSCLPGISIYVSNPKGNNIPMLRKQCPEDESPVSCLKDDLGDVAFVSSSDLQNFNTSQYELLCLNRNGRDSLANYETCNVAMVPSRKWLPDTNRFSSDASIAYTPQIVMKILDKETEVISIYGEYLKNNNITFNTGAPGLNWSNFLMIKAYHNVLSDCGIANLP